MRKVQQPEEREMAAVSRKSLVLARPVHAGESIAASDLRLMRPGTGIPASAIPTIEGRRVRIDLPAFHQLRWNDLEGM
jgi:sialic acid synthase SpsE